MEDDGWDQAQQASPRRGLALVGVIVAVVALGFLARGGGAETAGGPDDGMLDIQPEASPEEPTGASEPTPTSAPDRTEESEPERVGEVTDEPEPEPTEEPVAFAAGRWQRVARPPLRSRTTPWVVAGDEVLLWGGEHWDGVRGRFFADGAALDPGQGVWRELPESPLSPRAGHAVVWTDAGLFVWGGRGAVAHHADGAVYDPASRTWRVLPPAPLSPRAGAAAAWTGEEVVVVGGHNNAGPLADAAAYDPESGRWRTLRRLPMSVSDGWVEWDVVAGTVLTLYNRDLYPGQEHNLHTYVPAVDSWRAWPSPPTPLEGARLKLWPVQGALLISVAVSWEGTGSRIARGHGGDWRGIALPQELDLGLSDTVDVPGGVTADGRFLYVLSASPQWWRYDLQRRVWQRLPEGNGPGSVMAARVVGDELVVLLGEASESGFPNAAHVMVWRPGRR